MYNTSVCYRSILNMIKRSLSSSFLISLFIYVVIYLFIYLLFFWGVGGGGGLGVEVQGYFSYFSKNTLLLIWGRLPQFAENMFTLVDHIQEKIRSNVFSIKQTLKIEKKSISQQK